jgi:cyanophycinase
VSSHAGPLALVGGDEFRKGNEPHDQLLSEAAAGRPAYLIATAARDHPEAAVATARRWFARLGVDMQELRVRTPAEARSPANVEAVAGTGLLYIAGGDPGRVANVLRDSPVWNAMRRAWREGCALAGSSAGAMALCQWTLVRRGFPGHTERRPVDALGLLPGSALLPHFETFGHRWIPSAQETLGRDALLIGIDERTAGLWHDGTWRVMGAGSVTLIRRDRRDVFASGSVVAGLPQPGFEQPEVATRHTSV